MKLNNKKSGFTLAEVLVTLMIIGVIAAMTIPSLMQSTSSQEYKTAFKKAVSMLNQAVTLNYALDGEDGTDFTGASFFNLMTKRLNVMSSSGNTLYTADGMWFSTTAPSVEKNKPSVPNGGACSTEDPTTVCSVVYVDVNGAKGPNAWAESTAKVKDIFAIAIYAQKALPATDAYSEILYSK